MAITLIILDVLEIFSDLKPSVWALTFTSELCKESYIKLQLYCITV